jgi:hypothetical protein
MRRPPLSVLAPAACALAILWGVADSLRPFVTFDHDVVVATPALGALEQRWTATLQPGDEACIRPVVFTPDAEVVRLRVLTEKDDKASPIEVVARGPGYESKTVLEGYGTGFDQTPLARITPPEGEVEGEVCARNAGTRDPVQLVGTDEIRSQVPAETIVNGQAQDGKELEVTLLEAERRTYLSRTGEILDRASALTAGYAPTWLLWIVCVLAALGIPAAIVAGLYRALREDDATHREPA